MLQTSTKSILDAEKRAHDVRTRNDHITRFIRATSECVDARKNAARHTELVRWVRDQVQIVRAETARQTERAANGSHCGRSAKRGLRTDDSPSEDAPQRKRRRLDKTSAPASPKTGLISGERHTSTALGSRRENSTGEILGSRWEQMVIGPPRQNTTSLSVRRDVRRSVRISSKASADHAARRPAGRTRSPRCGMYPSR